MTTTTTQNENNNTIHCLDHGFVRLIDVMGNDEAIVQAARVSYGTGTKSVREDRGLIHYLMQHLHTTPFEMVEFKFHCKMPIFVARQWIRHRTANVNEISGRYSVIKDEFWVPTADDLRTQSTTNRQGSNAATIDAAQATQISDTFANDVRTIYDHYESAMNAGVAREIARVNLPLSTYTEWYWKIDLHNLCHFLKLRLDPHAQKEIRVYAEAMGHFVKQACPIAWEAFEEYQLHGTSLSQTERRVIRATLEKAGATSALIQAFQTALKEAGASDRKIERELEAFTHKLCLDEKK